MNSQEYENKKRECWEEFCQHIVDEEEAFYNMFDRAYALGKEKESITQEEIEKAIDEYVRNNPFAHPYSAIATRESYRDGIYYALGKQEKDAEGEEMQTVSRTKIEALHSEIHKAIMDAHDADDWQDAAHYILDILPRSFNAIFGSKCLPDEKVSDCHHLQEPKSAEPKYHVGQRMYIKFLNKIGTIDIVQGYNEEEDGIYYHLMVEPKGVASAREDFLEPYTEPKEDHIGENPDMVKDFDTILKDSFRNDRRCNITVQMVKALTQSPEIIDRISSGCDDGLLDGILHDALYLTDKLIAECEKGNKS